MKAAETKGKYQNLCVVNLMMKNLQIYDRSNAKT